MGTDNSIYAVRVAYIGQKNQDRLYFMPAFGLTSFVGDYIPTDATEETTCEPADVKLLLRVRDAANFHTSIFLGSVPKNIVDNDRYSPDVAFSTILLPGFIAELESKVMIKGKGSSAYALIAAADTPKLTNRKTGRSPFLHRGR